VTLSKSHRIVLGRLLHQGWCADRFGASLLEGLRCTGDDYDERHHLRADCLKAGILPDAWRFVPEGLAEGWGYPVTMLELAEVVVTNRLSEDKLDRLVELWFCFDASDCYALRVRVFDQFGQPSAVLDDDYFAARFHGAAA